MKDFWNSRYADKEYAYGTEPNNYFKQIIDGRKLGGRILLPAEGEGRNAVYAAKKGLEVFAFDISIEGKIKALKLAKNQNIKIAYEIGDFLKMPLKEDSFDAAALIFAHFPPNIISVYHKKIADLLKPGGIIILEGFSKRHFDLQLKNPSAGGPKNIDMLFSKTQISSDFKNFKVLDFEEKEVVLEEGIFHKGKAQVIRFCGVKK
ncbi:MAG: SAM-dependent methyltransferase [Marinilabiliales bacterium]|nr:MAG: SAM-dependent methyltransferase [Marinilabiliales bacterium]